MLPEEFALKFLPAAWSERDLQILLQKRLAQNRFIKVHFEQPIKTATTTRRADLATWSTIYEVKTELTRERIFHAVAQTELYASYGTRILSLFPKRRVVLGLAPSELREYQISKALAKDFERLGVKIVFVNEEQEWIPGHRVYAELVTALILASLPVAAFFLSFAIVSSFSR